jgi:hypothetical protein
MRKRYLHNAWVIGGGAIVVVVILALASWQYGGFLGAKTNTPGIVLAQGETYTMAYKTSATVPTVKIEICRGTKCTTLAVKASGSQLPVEVPKNYTLGAAFFKVSERNKAGALTGKIQKTVSIVVVGAANPTPKEEDKPAVTPTATPTFDFSSNAFFSALATITPTPKLPTPKPPQAPLLRIYYACVKFEANRPAPVGVVEVSWQAPRGSLLGFRPVGATDWQLAPLRIPDDGPITSINQFGFAAGTKWSLGYNQDYDLKLFRSPGGPNISESLIKTYRANSGPAPSPTQSRTRCITPMPI